MPRTVVSCLPPTAEKKRNIDARRKKRSNVLETMGLAPLTKITEGVNKCYRESILQSGFIGIGNPVSLHLAVESVACYAQTLCC